MYKQEFVYAPRYISTLRLRCLNCVPLRNETFAQQWNQRKRQWECSRCGYSPVRDASPAEMNLASLQPSFRLRPCVP
ncbi:hypothetical protein VUR80DRAFT_1716 [Thermomyces stellatus]